jgi:glycosyltransferase involved in cell wall biosynthesis
MVAHRVDDSGGMERVHAEIVRRLLHRYEFLVIASHLAPDLRERVQWQRVWAPQRPASVRFPAFYALAGIRLAKLSADLVHTCGSIVPNHVEIASVHFCQAGFIDTNGGHLTPPDVAGLRQINMGAERVQALWAERWSYRPSRIRLLAAVSGQIERELEASYPEVPRTLTPNGVDTRRFRASVDRRQRVRSELAIGQDTIVVLFVGGNWDRKGLHLAIRALAAARNCGVLVNLWVVGTGDTRRFGHLAGQLGVRHALKFCGRRDDIDRFFLAADVYLCCSMYEAFSLALLEAAASALPLVTTDVGGARELIGGGDTAPGGMLVDPDPGSIGRTLVDLARDPELRRRLGDAARSRAQKYGWEDLALRIDEIYQKLLGLS